MCKFLSAIVIREPRNKGGFELKYNLASDSHSDLIRHFGLKDDGKLRFARVEFSPLGNTFADPDSYKLTIDEERAPDWFDADMKDAVANKLRAVINSMIVRTGGYLLGGHHIVPKDIEVEVGPNTLVHVNMGTVTRNYGTVTDNPGTVTDNSGTVTYNSGTVTRNYGTVTYNSGTVTDNPGTVTRNYGTVTNAARKA